MDMPITTHQFDALACAVSKHTKLSRRAFKKAVATAFDFGTVDHYEHHLDKRRHLWSLERTISRYMAELHGLLSHFGIDPKEDINDKAVHDADIDKTTSLAHYLAELSKQAWPLTHPSLASFKQAVSQCDTADLPDSICAQLPDAGESVVHDNVSVFGNPHTASPMPRQPIIALRTALSAEDLTWLWALQDAAFAGTDNKLKKLVSGYLQSLCEHANDFASMIGMPLTEIAVSLCHTQHQHCSTYNPKVVIFGNALTAYIPVESTAPWMPDVDAHKVLCWYSKESLHTTCQRLAATTRLSTLQWKHVFAKMNGFNKVDSFLETLSATTFFSHTKHVALSCNNLDPATLNENLKSLIAPMTSTERRKQGERQRVLSSFFSPNMIIGIAAQDIHDNHISACSPTGDFDGSDDDFMKLLNDMLRGEMKAVQKTYDEIDALIPNEAPYTVKALKDADPRTRFVTRLELTRSTSNILTYLTSEKGWSQHPLSPSAWQRINEKIESLFKLLRAYGPKHEPVTAGEILSFIETNPVGITDAQAAQLLSRLVALPSKREIVPQRVRK